MTTRKPDAATPANRQPVRVNPEGRRRKDAEVVHSKLQPSDDPLTLDDDFGGDPYNSTGRFTTLKNG